MTLSAVAGTAQEQEAVQSFTPDYFAQSAPADAYDMVRRLPGFELIEGDSDVRGFSGSRGNVLFDGRAPAGKQESLEQILRRIPSASVLRIELIRGGAKGAAATAGFDLVANVIRRSASTTSSSLMAGATAADRLGLRPDLRAEVSHQSGERRLDAAMLLETDVDDDSGRGSIVERAPDGAIISNHDRDERQVERLLSGDAQYKLPLAGGTAVANFGLARNLAWERIRSADGPDRETASEREREWNGEAGGQFQTDFGANQFEASAVQRIGRLRSLAREDDESFAEVRRTSESIVRAEVRRNLPKLRLFGSLEGAVNRLSSDARLIAGGEEVPLAGSDVKVEERRAEGAIGGSWQPTEDLAIESSLRAELSAIRSTGDSPQSEHFLFWKPRLRTSWSRGSTRVSATVEREASQLDFGDFVASAELDRDDVVAGAVSLRPATTWSFGTTFEQRFWGDGALLLTYRHEWIDDVIDETLIVVDGEAFDAIGNIGEGHRRIARGELTLPFDHLGLAGVQVRASLTFVKSRVTDPVTGERRIISEDRPFEGDLRLTHDLPGGRWSWGAEVSFAHREREFRFDEDRLERKGSSIGAFVEFRPAPAWRLRVEGENLTSRNFIESRSNYDGSRALGILDTLERRRLRTSPIFAVSLRKTFGAAVKD